MHASKILFYFRRKCLYRGEILQIELKNVETREIGNCTLVKIMERSLSTVECVMYNHSFGFKKDAFHIHIRLASCRYYKKVESTRLYGCSQLSFPQNTAPVQPGLLKKFYYLPILDGFGRFSHPRVKV